MAHQGRGLNQEAQNAMRSLSAVIREAIDTGQFHLLDGFHSLDTGFGENSLLPLLTRLLMLGLPKRFFGRDKPPENPAAPQHEGTQHVGFKTWIQVNSSNLEAVWYDPESEILKIRFNPEDSHGQRQGVRSYAYSMVPMSVFLGLLNASSKGKYHAKHIKWNYPYTQLGYMDG